MSYTRTSGTYNPNGRHGIDNLSFNRSPIPEPGVFGLTGLSGLALLARRRKKPVYVPDSPSLQVPPGGRA